MRFEMRVETRDSVIHVAGTNPDGLSAAVDMRDNWRTAPPDGYYNLSGADGIPRPVYARDIVDVQVTVR
jgi:hypothetical protein